EIKACELVEKYQDQVERELEAFPYRDRSTMRDPAAWLIKAIESGDYSQPVKAEKKRAEAAARRQLEAKQEREEKYTELYFAEYVAPFRDQLETNNAEAFEVYQQRCERMDRYSTDRDECERERFKLWDLVDMSKSFPELGFLTLDD